MTPIRDQIESLLSTYEVKLKLSKSLVERHPKLDDGRVLYWQGKVETCQEILTILDSGTSKITQFIIKELTGI